MPDFLRWIIAGVTSVVVAGLVFLLATVGIVVAFFVFLVLFVVFGLADTYELSPDEYTVEAAPSKKPGDTDPKSLGDHGKS